MATEGTVPVLWHLKASHYNEKARWALDYKGVPHVRRAAIPGQHRSIANKLTGGSTFPVLQFNGEVIGDSTRIIRALEQRYPEPPLYPADPDDRRRALALEDWFDEGLGPASRLLFLHHALPDANLMLGAFAPDLKGMRRLVARASFPRLRPRVVAGFGIDEETVALSFDRLREAGDRLRAERQPSGYLVGDGFTVADLTLAALLAPLVAPEQFPYPQPQRDHPRMAPVREALDSSGLTEWARDMYARHRGQSAEVEAARA
jgi:glutathione S-transferase